MGTYENQVARIAAQPDWEVQSGITRYREAAAGLVTGAKAIGKQPGLEGKAGDASAEQAHAVVKMAQTDGLGTGDENDALKHANTSARQANVALQQLRDDYRSLPGVRLPAHVVDAIATATSPIAVAVSVLGGPVAVAGEAGLQMLNNMLIQNRERAAQDALQKFKGALSAASSGIGDKFRPDPPTPLQVKEPNPSDFPHVDASGAAATTGAFNVGGASGSGSSSRVSAAGLGAGAAVGAAGILGLSSGAGAVGYASSGDQGAHPRTSVSDPGLGSISRNGDREAQRPDSGSTGPGTSGPTRSGSDSLTGIGSGNPSTDYDMGLGGVLPGMALGGLAAGGVAAGASRLSGAAAAGTVDATILGSAAGGAAGGAGGVGAGGMGRGLLGGLSADASKAGGAGTPEGLAGKVGMAGAKAGGAAEAAGARGGQPGMLGAPGGAGGDRQKGRRHGAGLGLIAPQLEEEAGPRIRSVGAMKGGRHHPGPVPRDLN
jgi:type II secretory pathway pseudopilin PulG